MHFQAKSTLKSNRYHYPKHPLNPLLANYPPFFFQTTRLIIKSNKFKSSIWLSVVVSIKPSYNLGGDE